MKQKHEIEFDLLDSSAELPADEKALLDQALAACDHAYAPFSQFQVGCAVQFADGQTVTGTNQENRAFPSGLCAERSALFHAGSIGKGDQVRKIAVRARSAKKPVDVPVTPCGACRQVMLDYEKLSGKPVVVILQGETGKILKINGVSGGLVPFAFDFEF